MDDVRAILVNRTDDGHYSIPTASEEEHWDSCMAQIELDVEWSERLVGWGKWEHVVRCISSDGEVSYYFLDE